MSKKRGKCEGEKTDSGLEWQGEMASLSHLCVCVSWGKNSGNIIIKSAKKQSTNLKGGFFSPVPQVHSDPGAHLVGTIHSLQKSLIDSWVTENWSSGNICFCFTPFPNIKSPVLSWRRTVLSKSNFSGQHQLKLIKLSLMKLVLGRREVSRMKTSTDFHSPLPAHHTQTLHARVIESQNWMKHYSVTSVFPPLTLWHFWSPHF